MKRLFTNARLILSPNAGIRQGSLLMDEGGILEISDEPGDSHIADAAADEIIDCCGDFISPGFIDLHCHGALGSDAMEATSEAFDKILNYHATRGTTLAVLTTVAASLEEIQKVLRCAESYRSQVKGSRLAGIHLEGPYFSPHKRGVHRGEMLRCPDPEESRAILSHARVIKRMTLAPELPGALELVAELAGAGVAVSAGHSNASEAEAMGGFAAGVTQVTHLYNCMSSLQSDGGKRLTGLAEAALTTPGIFCEVIADGIHLPPTLLRLAWLAKGWEKVILVSDATAGAGLEEGAFFELGGLSCRVEEGASYVGEGEERRLAGSTLGMIDAVRGMVDLVGIPLEQSVAMATLVPARALGLEKSAGSLVPGKKADLVRFSENWEVRGVWSDSLQIV